MISASEKTNSTQKVDDCEVSEGEVVEIEIHGVLSLKEQWICSVQMTKECRVPVGLPP